MASPPPVTSWYGSYARQPLAYALGPPPVTPLAIPVSNTAGQWMFAVVSWRQDAGVAGELLYPSTVTVGDDAHNLWVPVESGQWDAGIVRSAVWMAPAARVAEFVYVMPTAWQTSLVAQVFEVPADCPWYQVTAQASAYANQATSITQSQTGTSGQYMLGVVAADSNSAVIDLSDTGWTPIGSVSAGSGSAGAYLGPQYMFVSDYDGAVSQWTGDGLYTPTASRYYLGASVFTFDTNMQEMAAAGVKICLTLRPAYNPVSSADLASMVTLLQEMQAAGAVADITLWHEAQAQGLSVAQFAEVIAYYGPAVQEYYPLVFVTSVESVNGAGNGNAWFIPGAFDKVATDFYCLDYITKGYTLDAAATPANTADPPLPFGLWEFGISTDPLEGFSSANGTAYMTYIQDYFTTRAGNGLPNADLLWFNNAEYNLLGLGTSQEAGFEGGTGTWITANCTITDTSAQAHTGSDSCQLTSSASGSMRIGTPGGTSGVAVSQNSTYTISGWFRAATTARSCQTGVAWYNASGTQIGSNTFGTGVTNSTSAWTQVSTAFTSPSGAAYAQPLLQVISTGAANEVHYIDDAIIGEQSFTSSVIGFNFGSATASDYRIALLNDLYAALGTGSGAGAANGLRQYAFDAVSAGSSLTLGASSSATMDWAEVIVTISGVTDTRAFGYSVPMENLPVLLTQAATGEVLNTDPVFADGATWYTGQGATVAGVNWPQWTPVPSYQGLQYGSLQVTPAGTASAGGCLSALQPLPATTIPYQASAWVYTPSGYGQSGLGSGIYAGINWYSTSSLSSYLSTTAGPVTQVQPGTWTELTLTSSAYPPSGAAYAAVVVTETTNGNGNISSTAPFYAGYAALGTAGAYENIPPDEFSWTDLSARNYDHDSIRVDRGIQYEQQSLEAGTLEVNLQNYDGDVTFGNVQSPFFPFAGDTDVWIRLLAIWPGSPTPYYPLFTGYTDDIKFGWDDEWYGYAKITASDAWSRLTQQLVACHLQDLLEDNPAALVPCSLSGANIAVGAVTTATVWAALQGSGNATSTFQGGAISLLGAQGLSSWQVSAVPTSPNGGSEGIGLGFFPPLNGPDAMPPTSGGVTVEFWFQPTQVEGDQPEEWLTVCTCWGQDRPAWSLTLNNLLDEFGYMAVTVYDRSSGTGTTTELNSSPLFLSSTALATSDWFIAVTFNQSSLTVAQWNQGSEAGGPGTVNTTTVECNLTETLIGLSFAGNVGPVFSNNNGSTPGMMSLAVYGIAVYPYLVPAARLYSHYTAALTAFPDEPDTWRLARITGYSGFVPSTGMRGLDLTAAGYPDIDQTTAATDTSGQVCSDYFTNIASSTLAAMFADGAGVLQYRRRLEWYDRPVPQWQLGQATTQAANLNGSFQSGTTGWQTGNSATLTAVHFPSGYPSPYFQFAGQFHGNGSAASPYIAWGAGLALPNAVAASQGTWWTATAWAYSTLAWASGLTIGISFYNASSGLISTVTSGAVPLAAGSLTLLNLQATQAPAAAAWAVVVITAAGTPTVSQVFNVTAVDLAPVPTAPAGGAGATAQEVPYHPSVQFSADRAQLFNEAILTQYGTDTNTTYQGTSLVFTPTSGVTVQITNNASAALRGSVPYTATVYLNNTVQALPYTLNDPSMEDFGNWITQTLASPVMRAAPVMITPSRTPQALTMGLGCEVGDTVTLYRQQLGIPVIVTTGYCSKITHEISVSAGKWDTSYELSPFPVGAALACDNVLSGTLDGSNFLSW